MSAGDVLARAHAARAAGRRLVALGAGGRSALLADLAAALTSEAARVRIEDANRLDRERTRAEVAQGAGAEALLHRLGLDGKKLAGLADGLRQLAAQPDLVGAVTVRRELDEGWCWSG